MFEFNHIETLIKESSSVWIDLLVTFLGTLIGFIGAFYLTNRSTREQNRNDRQIIKDTYISRLRYLVKLIEASIKIINDQLDNFENLAKEIKEDPTEFLMLKIIASNDLQRLQNMDTEEIFHAYHLIIPESENKAKDYKNIYGCIDYLYLRHKQAIESNDKHINFMNRDQMYIKETIESLSNMIYQFIKTIETKERIYKSLTSYKFLVSNHKNYINLIEESSTLGVIENEFLIPFGTELRKSFSNEAFFGDLNTLSTKAIIRFNHVKINSGIFANDLFDVRKEMANSLKILNEIKEKIKSSLKEN